MQEKKPIRQILLAMEPGQTETFPAAQTQSVSSTASLLSFQENRKYTTRRNAEQGVLEVTRIS